MNPNLHPAALATTLLLAGCAMPKIAHTKPGTSVEFALAKKAELVKAAPVAPVPGTPATAASPTNVPAVEPPMPERNIVVEKVGDAYSRGIFCLRAERDAEAVAAFEEAVKLDPTFTDAWENLALLYEKMGDPKKALEAFKKAKTLARQ